MFFHLRRVAGVDRSGVGEGFLFQAADVDVAEFESLGCVKGEKVDGVDRSSVAFEAIESGEVEELLDGFPCGGGLSLECLGEVSKSLHLFGCLGGKL